MFIPETSQQILDDLLLRICNKLQLTDTQHKQAEEKYGAVGQWLSRNDSPLLPFNPTIYPQGSLRIGTTVKPMLYQEYDLDLVCELNIDHYSTDPIALLNAVEKRLRQNKTYEAMIERKNRCIRLNYANEFHMDILPACPNGNNAGGQVKVPDRKAEEWKDSNPKGYAIWFENKAESYRSFAEKIAAADIEPIPDLEPLKKKPPLKRAAQLIKRYRDITFRSDEKSAPISIVLTTLAGTHYHGHLSLSETMSYVLDGITISLPTDGRLKVLNPTNHAEDLSERWDNDNLSYSKFIKWVQEFNLLWKSLVQTHGIYEIAKILKGMFGESVTNSVINEQAEFIENARSQSLLGVTTKSGILTSISTNKSMPIKKNTFYGS